MEYGLIPEFIGRLPVVAVIHQLTRDDLIKILTEPRNALSRQFDRNFRRPRMLIQHRRVDQARLTRGISQLGESRAKRIRPLPSWGIVASLATVATLVLAPVALASPRTFLANKTADHAPNGCSHS